MSIRLNKREKYAVAAMVLFCGIFVAVQFVVFPLIDNRNRLERAIQTRKRTVAELAVLHREYQEIMGQANSIRNDFDKRDKGFALFSFLDRLAGQAGIKDKISSMKPSATPLKEGGYKTSLVEMKIEGVAMNRLAPFLHMVETSKNVVYVRRLSISQTDKQDGRVNVVMQVETIETG